MDYIKLEATPKDAELSTMSTESPIELSASAQERHGGAKLPGIARPVAEDATATATVTRTASTETDTKKDSLVATHYAPRWFLAGAAGLMLASATFDTTATKYMNKQRLPTCDGCSPMYFQAPLFQTWTGYVGGKKRLLHSTLCLLELLFLPIFLWDASSAAKQGRARRFDFVTSPAELEKPKCPRWIWVFPLLLDFASTSCLNYATMLVQASTVQMLRSFNIILTFFLSAFVLKNRLYVHQIMGVILVLLGTVLVGLYAVINPDLETNYTNLQWLGIITALAGTGLSALQWVLEESIFRRFYCSPFEGVGWMGLYGVILGAAVLVLGQVLGFENVSGAFYQMSLGEKESHILIIFNILYVFSLAINTAAGITVTKLASSLLRTIVNAGRTVCIWALEMILGWADFQVLNFIGLIVIILAMIVYNYNYLSSRKLHWFGDTALRTPASCLPNKFEVPNYDSTPLASASKTSDTQVHTPPRLRRHYGSAHSADVSPDNPAIASKSSSTNKLTLSTVMSTQGVEA